jgi:hypothetical protein
MHKEIILNSFLEYDRFLQTVDKVNKSVWNALFSIRTYYALYARSLRQQTMFSSLKHLLKICYVLVFFPFFSCCISRDSKKVLLCTEDQMFLGLDHEIEIARIERKWFFSFRLTGWLHVIVEFITCVRVLLSNKGIYKTNVMFFLFHLLDYLIIYQTVNMGKIKVLIVENDLFPAQVAIIQKAKDCGIKTIKIEESFIDSIRHNNVLCEYYFCPGEFYYHIRSRFEINKELKYLSGGMIGWDRLSHYKSLPSEEKRRILFIAQHSAVVDDIFYINEVLSAIGSDDLLYIKVHPRDARSRFRDYINNAQCVVIQDQAIDNYALISKMDYCFSVSSVLAVEAKHIMDRVFFINYGESSESDGFDYVGAGNYFDVVSSHQQLIDILKGEFKGKTKECCYKGFNQGYPESQKKLKDCICEILGEVKK